MFAYASANCLGRIKDWHNFSGMFEAIHEQAQFKWIFDFGYVYIFRMYNLFGYVQSEYRLNVI